MVVAALAIGCGPRSVPQRLPELAGPGAPVESPASVAFRGRTALLRATLARSKIALDATAGAIDTCETPTPSAECIRCDVATDLDGVDPDLIDRVAIAIALYPPKVLDASAIEHVALCRRLRYGDPSSNADSPQGVADPQHRRLMISVEAFVGKDPDAYSIEQIVHHELFHLFDAKPLGDDAEWIELKPPGVEYLDPAPRSSTRPAGFVNQYATTNEREDRASVYEYLMSHADRLCEYAKTDSIVAAKTTLVWRRMAAVGGDAFLRRQAPCIDWVEIGPRPPTPAFRMRAAARR